jgi:DNA-binding NarL/FixJ family response regulator
MTSDPAPHVGRFRAPRNARLVGYLASMAIEVVDLPSAAAQLDDLTSREQKILSLIAQGLASRDIARSLELTESTVYRVIADLLDAVELEPPTATADDIHRRAATRPATADEVARFHAEFGPFDADGEG